MCIDDDGSHTTNATEFVLKWQISTPKTMDF